MLILSHNVHDGGASTLPYLLDWANEHQPDILTLQEVTGSTVERWCRGLTVRGYHVRHTFEFANEYNLPSSDTLREDGLLIAARWPVTARSSLPLGVQWPERILTVIVHHPDGEFEVHTTHVPNGSQGYRLLKHDGGGRLEKKFDTLEGVHRALTLSPHLPRLLTGDFNEPQYEHENGRLTYWSDYRATPPRYRTRWRAAGAGVFEHLPILGVRDLYRTATCMGTTLSLSVGVTSPETTSAATTTSSPRSTSPR